MAWERPATIVPGEETTLAFRIPSTVTLEPYMGMVSHAAVTRTDGSVFVHVHPTGTISMGAQRALAMRTVSYSVPGALGRRMTDNEPTARVMTGEPGVVRFPFEFPAPGRYRIWAQVKVSGKVMTGTFDAAVAEPD